MLLALIEDCIRSDASGEFMQDRRGRRSTVSPSVSLNAIRVIEKEFFDRAVLGGGEFQARWQVKPQINNLLAMSS